MRHAFIALLFSLAFTQPLAAQNAASGAIQSTIQNQITAFQADDFATAFSFASPMIKGIFGTSDNFGTMVQRGYPMVHRPSAVRMLDLRDVDGKLWQRVMITDQSGATHLLDYQMIEGPEGWQINAVQLLPQSGLGA
ncbi:DUF4864 domain-containing protein [Pseudorhodobacter sp. E13]|uniref:DUF4864 domain-containing protein n=1 Tax=Pseudorhodobacter sp. E13 TaxID=2487931 RepID=UPI000F8EAEED|nr:DUF4864 domain-containing protein [Pseudorhodobacter sp. E13]RUS65053.1 DUF4864 domain-containing protein [Pseudorhodobacter sp. E13]